jgi:hypothetical protein
LQSQIGNLGLNELCFALDSPTVCLGVCGLVIDEEIREWLSHDQSVITKPPLGELQFGYFTPIDAGG